MEKRIHKHAAVRRPPREATHVASVLNTELGRLEEQLRVHAATMESLTCKITDTLLRLERGDSRFEAHSDRIHRLETVVYGAVSLVCIAVFSALVYMVVKK